MEFLLINHPLDCPVCDKGGECPLQNQAMSNGRGESRFTEAKRTFPKPINISSQVLLDRERCVLCARCTRFSEQIAGDPFIELLERGALQQVGIYEKEPFESYFSGNTDPDLPGRRADQRAVPLPVPAVRPGVDARASASTARAAARMRTDHRRGKVMRRLAGDDPEVNEEWNCDKGRFAFRYASAERPPHRTRWSATPRPASSQPASWSEAFARRGRRAGRGAAAGSACCPAAGSRSRTRTRTRSSPGSRSAPTTSTSGPGRTPTRRPTSSPRRSRAPASASPTRDLEHAAPCCSSGFEPEEEAAIVFLRLRKAAPQARHRVCVDRAAHARAASRRCTARCCVRARPGWRGLDALAPASPTTGGSALEPAGGGDPASASGSPRSPGGLSAALAARDATGARLAWVPRRAGERGARRRRLPAQPAARRPSGDRRGRAGRPRRRVGRAGAADRARPRHRRHPRRGRGRASSARWWSAASTPPTCPTRRRPRRAATTRRSWSAWSCGPATSPSAPTWCFPVAPVAEKSGTFVDWEGRVRPFDKVLESPTRMPDLRVLAGIADELGARSASAPSSGARRELGELGRLGRRTPAPSAAHSPEPAQPRRGRGASSPTWHQLLDHGRLQDGEPYLAGTARPPVARLSRGHGGGGRRGRRRDLIRSPTDAAPFSCRSAIADLPDRVVWLPTNSAGSDLAPTLGRPPAGPRDQRSRRRWRHHDRRPRDRCR